MLGYWLLLGRFNILSLEFRYFCDMTDKLLNLPKSKYMEVYTDKIDNFKNTISMKIDNP